MASDYRFDRSQPHFRVTLFFEEGGELTILYMWSQALARDYIVGDWRHPFRGDGLTMARHFLEGPLMDEMVGEFGDCYRIKIETVEP